MFKSKWTESEIQFLKDNHGILFNKDIARALNKSRDNVQDKAEGLGLRINRKRGLVSPGEVFGRLTVLEKTSEKKSISGSTKFLCRCECGTELKVPSSALRIGNTTSCGCKSIKPPGDCSRHSYYAEYRRSAKRRSLDFSLTMEEFTCLTSKECAYCGGLPRDFNLYAKRSKMNKNNFEMRKLGSKESVDRSWISVNGLDRIDSHKGYSVENCKPCCSICNYAKRDHSKEEFEAWLDRIVQFRTQEKK